MTSVNRNSWPEKAWLMYGTAWKKDDTTRLVEMALKHGFLAVDTANQAKHYQEALVGEALKKFWAEFKDAGGDRESLLLQTKFTSVDGQDSRLPYDRKASLPTQVRQSFESSLEHLHTDYLDSYLLHGPYNHPGLGEEDFEVWATMEALYSEGKTKRIGISNVNAEQLTALIKNTSTKPMVVQNRCFARFGWDKEVRTICQKNGIVYQGFSLLTANPEVLADPFVNKLAARLKVSTAQIIFRFAHQVGMVPLTGTSSAEHMRADIDSIELVLTNDEMQKIENASI